MLRLHFSDNVIVKAISHCVDMHRLGKEEQRVGQIVIVLESHQFKTRHLIKERQKCFVNTEPVVFSGKDLFLKPHLLELCTFSNIL